LAWQQGAALEFQHEHGLNTVSNVPDVFNTMADDDDTLAASTIFYSDIRIYPQQLHYRTIGQCHTFQRSFDNRSSARLSRGHISHLISLLTALPVDQVWIPSTWDFYVPLMSTRGLLSAEAH
jgi:hypothetical protein